MPDCKSCKEKQNNGKTFGRDLDSARLTRTIKHLITAYVVTVVAFILALVMVVVAINNKWLAYLSEYDAVSYDYAQDGNGVNIIGDDNGVKYNVTEITSQSENQEDPQH